MDPHDVNISSLVFISNILLYDYINNVSILLLKNFGLIDISLIKALCGHVFLSIGKYLH